jgi:ANTAR domain-containing protein/GAF domain-containing protein
MMPEPDDASAAVPDPKGTSRQELRLGIAERFEAAATGRGVGTDDNQDLWPDRLCQAVVDVLDVDGAAISVYLGGDVAVPVGANDLDASMGEALQFTVREGPCFESYRTWHPVLILNLRDPQSPAWTHWPIYAAQLTQHTPYDGVFAYPLMDSDIVLGSLSLYRRTSGLPQHLEDADVIAAGIADRLAEELFTKVDGESTPRWLDSPTGLRRRLVWQAQGLTAQANRITPGQAIDLLRAQAYSADRVLDDVAEDIVNGRLPVPDLPSDS